MSWLAAVRVRFEVSWLAAVRVRFEVSWLAAVPCGHPPPQRPPASSGLPYDHPGSLSGPPKPNPNLTLTLTRLPLGPT